MTEFEQRLDTLIMMLADHNGHFVNKDDAERYIKVLEAHNKWRRDEHVPNSMPMQDPKEIGLAIDFAVDYIKTFMEL